MPQLETEEEAEKQRIKTREERAKKTQKIKEKQD